MSETQTGNPDSSSDPCTADRVSIRRKRIAAILALLALPLLLAGAFFTWYQFSRGALVYAVVKVRLANDEETNPEFLRQKRSAQVKSFEVLSHALNQPQVAQLDVVKRQADPLQWLSSELSVAVGASLEDVYLSMRGSNSAELVVVVDAVADAFAKSMGSANPEELAKKTKEAKEFAEKMRAQVPPEMREHYKMFLRSKMEAVETPRARVSQKATPAK